ncbi:DUF5348 domain-containing protein [Paenibacillus polymyxa]|uniref:DUF5348 domain-containing protein n=1 Tax=Paenibacillus TaxID=44249 RepID=UPI0020B8EF8E|nr:MULTISPECIES: DUF5348 domain-containing protein [Paenibacillus]MCP3807154.1 DUF5348 domain-containing protein [Paenibacillus sp. Lou8.1]MDN4078174.1 DUF5348 domain-containing protein [Paenibacillus polymyxa]MDN4103595.1 DUF5348 domain-containing protein [Paenibacillus polymyxa]MDN4113772.1 DUF5348 domain-containing protein [Paenibacillus polymyxa]
MSKSFKDQISNKLVRMIPQLNEVIGNIDSAEESWTSHYSQNNPQDMYLRDMFQRINEKLGMAIWLMFQAFGEVAEEGILRKRPDGRYGFGSTYFTTGSKVEYLDHGDQEVPARWVYSHVQHNGKEYYISDNASLSLDGLLVRVKRFAAWG